SISWHGTLSGMLWRLGVPSKDQQQPQQHPFWTSLSRGQHDRGVNMKNITGVFCVVIASLLTAFSTSALAAKPTTKTYIWSATVGGVNNAQTSTRISFFVQNTNPNNSSAAMGYIQIDLAPASGVHIVGFESSG